MKSFITLFLFVVAAIVPSHADTLTIAMVGDIMMGTTFPSEMLPANNGNDLFNDAKPLLLEADLTVGNLEGTLCGVGPRHDKTGAVIRQLKMLSESDIPQSQAIIDEKGHIKLKK